MKVFTMVAIIFWILLLEVIGSLAIWIDYTSPAMKYSCSGEGLTLRKFDNYTCIDCCYVEVDGFYEFKFPKWVKNDGKLILKTSELNRNMK